MKDLKLFFFFFSSRRRHTRWNCDWSSDVCSSDLLHLGCDLARRVLALAGLKDPPPRRFGSPTISLGQRRDVMANIYFPPSDALCFASHVWRSAYAIRDREALSGVRGFRRGKPAV